MSRKPMKRIKTWRERCEEHPDHQERIISERMIQERMQEEIDELRQALETDLATVWKVGVRGKWQGLTDEQVEDEWERITQHSIFGGARSEGRAMHISPNEVIEFSRAIEAKLRKKNHG